ncbi:reverse transcriptase-like protein [Chloroflexia bacterium SDU3-3]|nr:reverse transcriptase-like protein [Chloroflexia bacterium SDU3-3]
MDPIDSLTFEGACEPNPCGMMTWRYAITLASGSPIQGSDIFPASPSNTLHVAEYCGLLAGLHAYIDSGQRGPLRIIGESQMVIYQLKRIYPVLAPGLKGYYAKADALLAQIHSLSIVWYPRTYTSWLS